MRFFILKFFKVFFLIFTLYSCTDSVYMENNIPVSSNELIDNDIIYKSPTKVVEKETLTSPQNIIEQNHFTDNSKEKKDLTKEQIIIPPSFENDEIVNSTPDNYNKENQKEKTPELSITKDNKDNINTMEETKNDEEISITYLSAILYHSYAKSDLQDKQKLEIVATIAKNKNAIVHVIGHSSSRTNDTSLIDNKINNFKMSLHRAETVRNYLVSLGIHPDKIFIIAASDTEKIIEEDIPSNEALNRRTEIYLSY